MDEADILSDEVAVIYRGKLLCSGSPLLLKSKYGCGYRLTVSRQGRSDHSGYDSFDESSSRDQRSSEENDSLDSRITLRTCSDVEKLMAFAKCLIPNASFVEDNNGEVILSLPHEDDLGEPHDYATFFRCFDSNIRTLGFGSYGVTSTTLEEVFLTLCNLEESKIPVDKAKLAVARRFNPPSYANSIRSSFQNNHQLSSTMNSREDDQQEIQFDQGLSLKFRQLYALLLKRFLHMIRDWRLLFCTLFLPCIFIAFAMAMTLIKPTFAPDPALLLDPQIYGQSTVSYFQNNHKHDEFETKFETIEQQLMAHKFDKIDCLEPHEKWRTAKCPILNQNVAELPEHLKTFSSNSWRRKSRTSCKCTECFADLKTIGNFVPPPQQTPGGWLYNLSRIVDLNQFLLSTQPEFMDRRWGGISFRSAKVNRSSHPRRRMVKIWFDNNGFHTIPSYLNTFNNALLRANLKESGFANVSMYGIKTYSHPLHVRSNQLGDQSVMQQAGDAGIAIIILVGFIFIPTSFVFYIVRERIYEEKHLQKTFGVGPLLYWLSSLLWDVLILIVAIIFSSAIIIFFQLPIYMSRLNLPAILTLLFFFGWAMINFVYVLEKFFNEPSLAFTGIYCLALFIGIQTMVMRLMIDVFKLIEITPLIYKTFEKIAILFPPYLLLSGIVDIHRNQLFADIFVLFDQDIYVNPFSFDLLGKHFTIFALQGLVLFVLNYLIESDQLPRFGLFRSINQSTIEQESLRSLQDEDKDVAEERRRVHSSRESSLIQDSNSQSNSAHSDDLKTETNRRDSNDYSLTNTISNSNNSLDSSTDILKVLEVSKLFENMFGYRCAVKNISFSVPRGECFGLLGVNGAGKTTLFRIITGQMEATTGETIFNGRNIREAISMCSKEQSIGYCPQADALDDFLTPIEHLTIYAHLRGIPQHQISKVES